MPDARGHGLSSEGGGNYSPEIRTDDLNAFIDALELDKPILAGHSMGAEISMRLAVRHPNRVRAAILEDPVLVTPGETVFGGWFGRSFQNSPGGYLSLLKTMKKISPVIGVPLTRLMNPGFPGSAAAPWFESKKRLSEDSRTTMGRIFEDWNSGYEWLDLLRIPVLLIVGNRRKGAIVSIEEARSHAENHPNIQIIHFPKANHNIRRSDFPGYLHAIKVFLNGLDSREFSDASFRQRERR